jgi:hypothetical protein
MSPTRKRTLPGCDFSSGGFFWTSTFWRSFIPARRFFSLRRNRKANDGGRNPPPLVSFLCHKTPGILALTTLKRNRPTFNAHTRFIGVSQWHDVPLLACPLARGGSRFYRPVVLKRQPIIAQALAALACIPCRLISGRRNRAGSSVVRPRLALTHGDGLEI